MRHPFILMAGISAVLLSACAQPVPVPDESHPTATLAPLMPSPTREPTATQTALPIQTATFTPPPAIQAEMQPALEVALADLRARLGHAIEGFSVLESEAVTWPDGSLGCPQPGMAYIQMLVPGFRLVLEVEGERYEYHTDRGGDVMVLCSDSNRRPAQESPTPVDPVAEELTRLAIRDLAERLDIPPDEVSIAAIWQVEWPDTSLGCPREGVLYSQVITPGYRLALSAGRDTYFYHTSLHEIVYCPSGDEVLPPGDWSLPD